ncbi:hypothetical protein D3C87_1666950 [compost metagenome]
MCKPHKHAAIIKAWADGAEIQVCYSTNVWMDVDIPSWRLDKEYRIKPEPKPDVVMERPIKLEGDMILGRNENRYYKNNCRFTFDGETGQLKAVEMI